MPIMFNMILRQAGFRLEEVRLLRHKDTRAVKGYTPYELWRDDRPGFDYYQSTQSMKNQTRLEAPFWAAFVGTPADETLFVGIYGVSNRRLLDHDQPWPYGGGIDKAGTCNLYDLVLEQRLDDLIGRLLVEWGKGERSWIQRSDRQDKPIIELRQKFDEPAFPGFLNFMQPLSKLDHLPRSWIGVLNANKGVYLLTCPRTREQYVGSASGIDGFWGRWQAYIATGHGGNVKLKSRDPSDYQVSILEVAGTAATENDILKMEQRWMEKLKSREMGLN